MRGAVRSRDASCGVGRGVCTDSALVQARYGWCSLGVCCKPFLKSGLVRFGSESVFPRTLNSLDRACLGAFAGALRLVRLCWPAHRSCFQDPRYVLGVLLITFGIFVGAMLCELMIATIVLLPFQGGAPDGQALGSSLALVRMTRAFAILSAVPASIGLACDAYLRSTWYDEDTAAQVTMLVAGYWYLYMVLIVWAHTGRVSAFVTAALAIPILTAISVFVAFMVIMFLFGVFDYF